MHYSRKCTCPQEQVSEQCSPDCSQFSLESCCCCCHCDKPSKPLVKGTFGLAYVVETPKKKFCKPLGWQVEFEDTPSGIVNNCKKMMKWVNCPPLGDCNNIETNFCSYPENCGRVFRDPKENNSRQCKCDQPKNLKPCQCVEDDMKLCYIKKSKRKPRSPVRETEKRSCSPHCERVCIICENCKINTSGCSSPPKVSCRQCGNTKSTCSKNLKCVCDCKCVLGKEDSVEKCCKCCKSKYPDFFRDCNDQCCRKNKKYNFKKNNSDDSLDYVPKKEDKKIKNRRSPDHRSINSPRERSSSPKVSPPDRSVSPKVKQQEKSWSSQKVQERNASNRKTENQVTLENNNYMTETRPVLKENKGTKMDSSKTAQTESGHGPIKQIDTKPVASTNLVDELEERKEKKNYIAPVLNAEEVTETNETKPSPNDKNETTANTDMINDKNESNTVPENRTDDLNKQDEKQHLTNVDLNTVPEIITDDSNKQDERESLTNADSNENNRNTNEDERQFTSSTHEPVQEVNKDDIQKSETILNNVEAEDENAIYITDLSGEPLVGNHEKSKESVEKIPLLQKIRGAHKKQLDEIHIK